MDIATCPHVTFGPCKILRWSLPIVCLSFILVMDQHKAKKNHSKIEVKIYIDRIKKTPKNQHY